jgi:hypothetical protein
VWGQFRALVKETMQPQGVEKLFIKQAYLPEKLCISFSHSTLDKAHNVNNLTDILVKT